MAIKLSVQFPSPPAAEGDALQNFLIAYPIILAA